MARTDDANLNAAVRDLRDVAAKLRGEYASDLFSWALAPFGGDGMLCVVLLRSDESQSTAIRFIQNVRAVTRGDVDDAEGVGHGFLPLADPLDGTGATAQLLNLGVGDLIALTVCSRTTGLRAFRVDASDAYMLAVVAVDDDLTADDVYAAEAAAELTEESARKKREKTGVGRDGKVVEDDD